MELAARSLDDVIRTGIRQSAKRVCTIGTQILSALHYLHSVNRIHRDVSAKNLLEFPNAAVKLSDFGVSKGNIAAGQATGTQLGNAMYLPPELLNAGRWTHQSDIYQLGVVLISLLIGQHVIPVNSAPATLGQMILDGIPRRTAEALMNTYGDLGAILSRMVCRTEKLRYPTAAVAQAALYQEYQRLDAIEQAQRKALTDALKALGVGAGLAWLGLTALKG
jgi:serine/threonine protein kinase